MTAKWDEVQVKFYDENFNMGFLFIYSLAIIIQKDFCIIFLISIPLKKISL